MRRHACESEFGRKERGGDMLRRARVVGCA
jgi:hypothetical protein